MARNHGDEAPVGHGAHDADSGDRDQVLDDSSRAGGDAEAAASVEEREALARRDLGTNDEEPDETDDDAHR